MRKSLIYQGLKKPEKTLETACNGGVESYNSGLAGSGRTGSRPEPEELPGRQEIEGDTANPGTAAPAE
jgi:hypothetical protein